MTKTYMQAPTTPEQEALFEAGYRVRRDENRKIFAAAPDGVQVYSGFSVPEAWTSCDIHAHPEKYQLAQTQPAPTINKIYFAGSIRGGRDLQPMYAYIIKYLQNRGYEVLSEHVGSVDLGSSGESRSEQEIYMRDIAWINEADAVIADVTVPSLGVGYEVAYAQFVARKPVLCIAQTQTNVSAMITGGNTTVVYYEHPEYLEEKFNGWFTKLKAGML